MPQPAPRLTVRAVRPLISGLRESGHDPGPLLEAAGLDATTLEDPDVYVPANVVAAFIAAAVDATRDANLGLHLAERAQLSSFDVHFYAMASSPTLGTAFERLCRYQRLIHETSRVELEVGTDQAILRHQLAGGKAAPRHSAEFLLAAWVRAGRLVTGVEWVPAAVHFVHPSPSDPSELQRFFRTELHFGAGANALILPAPLLAMPSVRSDPGLVALLDRYAAGRLEHAPRTSSTADRVRTVLEEELRGGEPSAAHLALRLKMSVRNLNRVLAAEGTTYRQLLDSLRRDLASRHLASDHLSIGEVGFLLGFSEVSAFHRAFKRWTNRTPAEFRRELRST